MKLKDTIPFFTSMILALMGTIIISLNPHSPTHYVLVAIPPTIFLVIIAYQDIKTRYIPPSSQPSLLISGNTHRRIHLAWPATTTELSGSPSSAPIHPHCRTHTLRQNSPEPAEEIGTSTSSSLSSYPFTYSGSFSPPSSWE